MKKNDILLCSSSGVNDIQIRLKENEHICNMVGDGVLSAAEYTEYIIFDLALVSTSLAKLLALKHI